MDLEFDIIKDEIIETKSIYGLISRYYIVLFVLLIILIIADYYLDYKILTISFVTVLIILLFSGYFIAHKDKKFLKEGKLIFKENSIVVNDKILHLDNFDKISLNISGFKGKLLWRIYTFNSETDGSENYLFFRTNDGLKMKMRFQIDYLRDEKRLRDIIKDWKSLGYDCNIIREWEKFSLG